MRLAADQRCRRAFVVYRASANTGDEGAFMDEGCDAAPCCPTTTATVCSRAAAAPPKQRLSPTQSNVSEQATQTRRKFWSPLMCAACRAWGRNFVSPNLEEEDYEAKLFEEARLTSAPKWGDP